MNQLKQGLKICVSDAVVHPSPEQAEKTRDHPPVSVQEEPQEKKEAGSSHAGQIPQEIQRADPQ